MPQRIRQPLTSRKHNSVRKNGVWLRVFEVPDPIFSEHPKRRSAGKCEFSEASQINGQSILAIADSLPQSRVIRIKVRVDCIGNAMHRPVRKERIETIGMSRTELKITSIARGRKRILCRGRDRVRIVNALRRIVNR